MTRVVNLRSGERYDVSILRPSYFSNPYRVEVYGREQALMLYAQHLRDHPEIITRAREELNSKTLGCVCKPKACHGDVLIAFMERRPWP